MEEKRILCRARDKNGDLIGVGVQGEAGKFTVEAVWNAINNNQYTKYKLRTNKWHKKSIMKYETNSHYSNRS